MAPPTPLQQNLVCRLLKALEGGHLPDDGGELIVDGIVYLSANLSRRVNVPNLYADLSQLLPDAVAADLDALYKNPQASTAAKLQALLQHFPTGRVVVLLDNFEDVLDPTTSAIADAELAEVLTAVLDAPPHAVKVLITTRMAPQALLLTQPGRQARVDLDEGLPSPYAENILRAMDADGKVGLRDADPSLLAAARERTRGYPRALEALFAILSADRSTTLPDLLADTAQRLPENVVRDLVGEAFSRLDPLAQHVMQALAIYGRPVTPTAIDYLLQPYVPSINSAPVLNRLVNMQFARKEAGRYYLHPVDRDYALSRVPPGTPTDRDRGDEPPWTQVALLDRGADYFQETRTPRDEWKTLDDLAPQLAEFELRVAGEDYETAASVLNDISFDYLRLWGYSRLLVDLHARIQGKLTDPWLRGANASHLGTAYHSLGDYQRAIDYQEQSLTIAREIGDREGEGIALGNLADVLCELGTYPDAIRSAREGATIAEAIQSPYVSSYTYSYLARTYLYLHEVATARTMVETAARYDVAENKATVLALLGVIALRQGDRAAARDALVTALAAADALLAQTAQHIEALDAKGLVLSGLALLEGPQHLSAALVAYRAARRITKAAGIVGRVLRLHDALAVTDEHGILAAVRAAAAA